MNLDLETAASVLCYAWALYGAVAAFKLFWRDA
jgi:hypothetical protein